MVWIGILLCLGITSTQAKNYETGVWGLSGFECDANWEAWNSRAGNKKDCDRYHKEGWCTEDGDYGETWKPRWGTFERYAEKKCYEWKANGECAIEEVGRTALACPQCGCRVVAKDAPEDKKFKYKIIEVGAKKYVRIESFNWTSLQKAIPYNLPKALNWYAARERCRRLGYKHGDLASMPVYEELKEIRREMPIEDSKCYYSWIGLRMDRSANDRSEWQWRWLTGETANTTYGWTRGSPQAAWFAPKSDYAHMAHQNPCGVLGQWDGKIFDKTCDRQVFGAVCSYLCQVSDTDDAAADDTTADAAAAAAYKANDVPADDN